MTRRCRFLVVLILIAASSAALFSQDAVVPWDDHYKAALPEGFDPWCGPVVGVSGPTDVVVATAQLSNGKPIDIYYPTTSAVLEPRGAVLFVAGNSDVQIRNEEGRPWMQSSQVLGWARLAAEHGLIAVAYENDGHPNDCLKTVGQWLRSNGPDYGIDPADIGLWSASNSCGVAAGAFRTGTDRFGGIVPRFSVFFYGDIQLRSDHDVSIPLFVTCGERDSWADNDGIQRFVNRLRDRGGTVEFMVNSTGSHAFDVKDDTEETRAIVEAALAFMVDQL